jgi:hypothetical protein
MQIKPNTIKCDHSEEHFLRRLGGAVVVHWDNLPEDLKTTLVKQAAVMVDRTVIVQAEYQIEKFAEDHSGGDL